MIAVRTRIATLALGAMLIVPVSAQETAPTTGRSIATLAQVPLKSRDGRAIRLGSLVARGKPTLVSVWASWCMPCLVEAPHLARIRRNLGSGYNFLYINRREGDPDPQQPAASIDKFLKRGGMAGVDYTIADVQAYRQIVGADIKDIPEGKVGIPRVYLFDRKGRQVHTAYGFDDADGPALEQRVRRAMAK